MTSDINTKPKPVVQTYSGRFINVLDIQPGDVDVQDIAHSLSLQCRFNGHCERFYSVAQHCVLGARMLPLGRRLKFLKHDAPEYLTTDIPSPLKPHIEGFKSIETYVHGKIEEAFGLDAEATSDAEVKEVDMRMLATEFRDVRRKKGDTSVWLSLSGIKPFDFKIRPWSPKKAEREYLRMYRKCIGYMTAWDRVLDFFGLIG